MKMSENVQPERHLTPKQKRAVSALLSGATKEQAAVAAGVTSRTLARWHEQTDFQQELSERTSLAVGDATRRLTGAMDLAVDVLLELAEDRIGQAPFSVRLRAAKYILDTATKLLELNEVMERLDKLEKLVASH